MKASITTDSPILDQDVVLFDTAKFLYKTTDYWEPEHERNIRWGDPALKINWQLKTPPALSGKDAQGKMLDAEELFA